MYPTAVKPWKNGPTLDYICPSDTKLLRAGLDSKIESTQRQRGRFVAGDYGRTSQLPVEIFIRSKTTKWPYRIVSKTAQIGFPNEIMRFFKFIRRHNGLLN